MNALLKDEIKRLLKKNQRWKAFIKGNKTYLKNAALINLNITTMEQEDVGVLFDVSIVYRLPDGKQEQSYESGIARINKDQKVKKINPEYAQQLQLRLLH